MSPNIAQIVKFKLVDALVVNLWQLVEFFTQGKVVFHLFHVLEGRKLLDVDIHGVQRINRDAVVGIAVGPSFGDCSIVDGKHLKGTLACLLHPVNHLLEVAKVAHTTTLFAAK